MRRSVLHAVYVAAIIFTSFFFPHRGYTATTDDALNLWTVRDAALSDNLYGITYGNGQFVAVGKGGTIITSPDGIAWTKQTSGVKINLLSIAFGTPNGNNLFVAVGGDLLGTSGVILTSPDGVAWTRKDDGQGNIEALLTVIFANNIFVVSGKDGSFFVSADGEKWEMKDSDADYIITGLAFGSNLFVGVGNSNPILTSTDGNVWDPVSHVEIPANLYDLTFGNNSFVAVGAEGTVFTSPDGKIWTERDSGISTFLFGAGYGRGIYVAVGGNVQGSNSRVILSSEDGIKWTTRLRQEGSKALKAVAHGGNRTLVAVGDGGTILQSDPLPLIPLPSGQATLTYEAVVSPELSLSLEHSKPIGIGTLASEGATLSIKVGFEQFSGPVDVYLGVDVPGYGNYIITPGGTLQSLADGLVTWKSGITGPLSESLFGDIAVSALPKGVYTFYCAVAPAGRTEQYHLWTTNFEIK